MAIVSIPEPEKQITLGISSCLLGHKVRYNGGHKRSSFCVNTLDKFFHFEPVCPEMAIGLGTPESPSDWSANWLKHHKLPAKVHRLRPISSCKSG